MQTAVFRGVEEISIEARPLPEVGTSQVLIRVHEAGICGTDMQIYFGKHPRARAPLIPGHEIFGTVEQMGSAVSGWSRGDRVVVYPLVVCGICAACIKGNTHVCERLGLVGIDRDGGFAEFVTVDADQLVAVPESISNAQAVIIEPLAVSVHAIHDSAFRIGDTVLVTGGGPIGNLLAQTLRAAGARLVAVSEVCSFRRKLLEQSGFATFNPTERSTSEGLRHLTGQSSVDIVFEASGHPTAYRDALESCGVRGHVSFVGIPKAPPVVDVQLMVYKEIHTSSARVYRRRDYAGAIALLASGNVDAKALITDRVPLASVAWAYQLMKQAAISGKIVIAPTIS